MIRFAAFCLVVSALFLTAPKAEAQMVRPQAARYGGTEVFVGSSREYVATYPVSYAAPKTTATYIPPYSYYVAPYPLPARPYVGLGSNDIFPYYGRPYGHPYDAWTWSYMGSYPTDYLAATTTRRSADRGFGDGDRRDLRSCRVGLVRPMRS